MPTQIGRESDLFSFTHIHLILDVLGHCEEQLSSLRISHDVELYHMLELIAFDPHHLEKMHNPFVVAFSVLVALYELLFEIVPFWD